MLIKVVCFDKLRRPRIKRTGKALGGIGLLGSLALGFTLATLYRPGVVHADEINRIIESTTREAAKLISNGGPFSCHVLLSNRESRNLFLRGYLHQFNLESNIPLYPREIEALIRAFNRVWGSDWRQFEDKLFLNDIFIGLEREQAEEELFHDLSRRVRDAMSRELADFGVKEVSEKETWVKQLLGLRVMAQWRLEAWSRGLQTILSPIDGLSARFILNEWRSAFPLNDLEQLKPEAQRLTKLIHSQNFARALERHSAVIGTFYVPGRGFLSSFQDTEILKDRLASVMISFSSRVTGDRYFGVMANPARMDEEVTIMLAEHQFLSQSSIFAARNDWSETELSQLWDWYWQQLTEPEDCRDLRALFYYANLPGDRFFVPKTILMDPTGVFTPAWELINLISKPIDKTAFHPRYWFTQAFRANLGTDDLMAKVRAALKIATPQ